MYEKYLVASTKTTLGSFSLFDLLKVPTSFIHDVRFPLRAAERHTYRVDLVDALAPLVTLSSDPVAVEVGADPVEDLAGETVILPLLGVKLEDALVHQILAVLAGRADRKGERGEKRPLTSDP